MYKLHKRDGEIYYALVCRYCRLVIYLGKVEDHEYIRKQKSEYFEEEELAYNRPIDLAEGREIEIPPVDFDIPVTWDDGNEG
jgi:hypothetical protein